MLTFRQNPPLLTVHKSVKLPRPAQAVVVPAAVQLRSFLNLAPPRRGYSEVLVAETCGVEAKAAGSCVVRTLDRARTQRSFDGVETISSSSEEDGLRDVYTTHSSEFLDGDLT